MRRRRETRQRSLPVGCVAWSGCDVSTREELLLSMEMFSMEKDRNAFAIMNQGLLEFILNQDQAAKVRKKPFLRIASLGEFGVIFY